MRSKTSNRQMRWRSACTPNFNPTKFTRTRELSRSSSGNQRMYRIVEPEVMDTAEAAEAYDAMGHGAVDQAFVDRVIALGASTGHFLDVGTGPRTNSYPPRATLSRYPHHRHRPLRGDAEDSKTPRRRCRSHGSDNPRTRRCQNPPLSRQHL